MEDGTLNGAMSQEEADCIVEMPLFLDNFALYLLTLDINTTVSTWLDRPEMMSDFPCVRGNCSTPEIGEIRLTSHPEPKESPFSETGQYNSFATI